MKRGISLVTTVISLLLCSIGTSDVRAKVFDHPYEGYTLWFPDDWDGGEPPADAHAWFSAGIPSAEEMKRYANDPCPDDVDVALISLRVEKGESCRAALEEKAKPGEPYLKWDERVIAGRRFLMVRLAEEEMTLQWACWSDGNRLFVFLLNVCTPTRRYHEYVDIWEKVIASLRLKPYRDLSRTTSSALPR